MRYELEHMPVFKNGFEPLKTIVGAALRAANEGIDYAQEFRIEVNKRPVYITVTLFNLDAPVCIDIALTLTGHNSNNISNAAELRKSIIGGNAKTNLPMGILCRINLVAKY